jgi:hypothetical protein
MQIALENPSRKRFFLGMCILGCITYLTFSTREFLAMHFSEQPDLTSLQNAIAIEPANAAYWHNVGRYHLFVKQQPAAALSFLRSAVSLNPHRADYWFDLSTAYQLLDEKKEQSNALERAIQADPTTPEVAWQAGNLYWLEGKPDKALSEFGLVAKNDPHLLNAALERCWRIRPDAVALLNNVLPQKADVYSAFLEFLISNGESAPAAAVWRRLAQLQLPVGTRSVFAYVQYLINHRQIEQAQRVWRDAANLADLSAYQSSSENLVVNNNFSAPVLNAGFDWLYQSQDGVTLTLDPSEAHSAPQSLAIAFDSGRLEDTGIRQRIPVEPDTAYEFSAYFKSENLEGAGGPRFVLQDALTGTTLFSSDELKDADLWKEVRGTFITNPDTRLLILRIARVPPDNAIRGRLWIDGVRLVKTQASAGSRSQG